MDLIEHIRIGNCVLTLSKVCFVRLEECRITVVFPGGTKLSIVTAPLTATKDEVKVSQAGFRMVRDFFFDSVTYPLEFEVKRK